MLNERSNRLRRRISSWIEVQGLLMPEARIRRAAINHASSEGTPPIKVFDIQLLLPSAFSIGTRTGSIELSRYEFMLREGQAFDALQDLRHQIRIRSHLFKEKDRFSRGVYDNTRSAGTISNIQRKIDRAVKRYRICRKAMMVLGPTIKETQWATLLHALEDSDIRGLSDGLMGDTEGTRRHSWIWTISAGPVDDGDDPDTDEGKSNTIFRELSNILF